MTEYENGRILDFGENVYVVDGRLMYIMPGTYDFKDREDVRRLLALAGDLFKVKWFPRRFGRETVCWVYRSPSCGERGADTFHCVDGYDEPVRSRMREALVYVRD